MKIHVQYTTQLKAALGREQESVDLDGNATVRDVLKKLAVVYPNEVDGLVMMDGEPLPSILFSLNDKQVDVDQPVQDRDTLTLLSAISGG